MRPNVRNKPIRRVFSYVKYNAMHKPALYEHMAYDQVSDISLATLANEIIHFGKFTFKNGKLIDLTKKCSVGPQDLFPPMKGWAIWPQDGHNPKLILAISVNEEPLYEEW